MTFQVSEHQCIVRNTSDLRWVKRKQVWDGSIIIDGSAMVLEQALVCIECGKVTWESVPIFDAKTTQYLRLNTEETQ